MQKLLKAIESGKQRGFSKSLIINDKIYWCGAAIQKYDGQYKVHVYMIEENKMVREEYDVYFTIGFTSIAQAINCVELNSIIKLSEFSALKGQKMFNPAFNEENEI